MAYSPLAYSCSLVARAATSPSARQATMTTDRRITIRIALSRRGSSRSSLHQRELQQQRALEQREIVVRNHRQHRVTVLGYMRVDPLHIVDLLAEIGLEDRGTVVNRAGREQLERNAPD